MQTRTHLIILLVFGLAPKLMIAAESESPTDDSATTENVEAKTTDPIIDPFLQRQQQLAAQLEATQSNQDVVWLKTAATESLALFRQDETGKRLGTIILIADIGSEVGQLGIIKYLSKSLTEKGWSTLNIAQPDQQPVTDTSDNELINAAISSAENQQGGDIYLLLLGRHQQTFNNLPPATKGLILINLPSNNKVQLPEQLSNSKIPLLDIVATRDHFMQQDAWQRRNNLAKSANLEYRQLVYAGVDREFSGVEKGLSRVISAWLKKQGGKE